MHRLFEMHLADLKRHGRDSSIPRMRIQKHLVDARLVAKEGVKHFV